MFFQSFPEQKIINKIHKDRIRADLWALHRAAKNIYNLLRKQTKHIVTQQRSVVKSDDQSFVVVRCHVER